MPRTIPPAVDTLRHIAIIPDGNRRWASVQNMPVWEGVRIGAQTTEAVLVALLARHIPWCTFWASSYENLTKRPAGERAVLNELFAAWFTRLAENPTIHRERVRVRALGEWPDLLAAAAAGAVRRVVERTAAYDGGSLTFLIGYDGDRELVAAVNAAARAGGSGQGAVGTVDDLRQFSWTKELPEVDLLIRTGSWEDPHRSANFLPLITSNVQEAYPKVYWPAFSETDLQHVIEDFAARGRRLGA
ncbi:MAG: tritranpolycis-undecaprenyl-diphosphate synthase [Parcubacteria group bacterium Gr01-1014_106]|nr:MAG: tritranpolycis-undecaprenyl-diphosphate synthase [Parcubacteria group bacterium Gr01-1014_106]